MIGSFDSQSFDTASIKISPFVQRPRSENPFPCGKPGEFIEFPLTFFNDSETGEYGPHCKTNQVKYFLFV